MALPCRWHGILWAWRAASASSVEVQPAPRDLADQQRGPTELAEQVEIGRLLSGYGVGLEALHRH